MKEFIQALKPSYRWIARELEGDRNGVQSNSNFRSRNQQLPEICSEFHSDFYLYTQKLISSTNLFIFILFSWKSYFGNYKGFATKYPGLHPLDDFGVLYEFITNDDYGHKKGNDFFRRV